MSLWNLFRRKKGSQPAEVGLREIWDGFQRLLAANNDSLMLMAELEERHASQEGFNLGFFRAVLSKLDHTMTELVAALHVMSGRRWPELDTVREKIQANIYHHLETPPPLPSCPPLLHLNDASQEQLAAMGGKSAHLALLQRELQLPVPTSLAATLTAYNLFLDYRAPGDNVSLRQRLQQYLLSWETWDRTNLPQAAQHLQGLVGRHPLPKELAAELISQSQKLLAGANTRLIVRSSGSREDLSASLAGLFDSFLGVTPQEVPERWRQVVASQFSQRALAYCQDQGLSPTEMGMAVLIQPLIHAKSAGVMLTTHPGPDSSAQILISAVWGLAANLMQDQADADEYLLAKEDGRLLKFRAGCKQHRLALRDGHLVKEPVEPDLISAAALEGGDLEQLAAFARQLENYFLVPQEVEWVKDQDGSLVIVQSRPLKVSLPDYRRTRDFAQVAAEAEVLLEDCRIASPGVAAGPVFRLAQLQDQDKVPEGVVLVVPRTSPQLAPVLGRVAALVTNMGSPTGHLALLAREVGLPMLVDTRRASERLADGEVVTVDAYHGKVYRGRWENLLRYRRRPTPTLIPSPIYHQLRAALRLIIPLTLMDPRHPDFRPENCRTYHDLAYFCHQQALEVMFGLIDGIEAGRFPALKLLKLDTTLPLNLHLIDLGGGLASYDTPVPPEAILSVPMRALWRGISHPDITWAGPVPVSVGGFLHVLGQSAIRPPERFWDKTYAIVAPHYVNYACRLGYHFSGVDSYCSDTQASNYINFTFKGGAADETRRIRRVNLIAIVLDHLGFEVEIHLDVIRARYRKRPLAETEEKLELLGRLMAYVRQMDMLMSNDAMVAFYAERFLAGHYERPRENG